MNRRVLALNTQDKNIDLMVRGNGFVGVLTLITKHPLRDKPKSEVIMSEKKRKLIDLPISNNQSFFSELNPFKYIYSLSIRDFHAF